MLHAGLGSRLYAPWKTLYGLTLVFSTRPESAKCIHPGGSCLSWTNLYLLLDAKNKNKNLWRHSPAPSCPRRAHLDARSKNKPQRVIQDLTVIEHVASTKMPSRR